MTANRNKLPDTQATANQPVLSIAARLLLGLVLVYRYTLSAIMGRTCRFAPSCSEYAVDAIRLHGALKGGWMAARRIARCHPWGGSGYDPVPPGKSEQ